MRTIHLNQAKLEAQEWSERNLSEVTIYKLVDGRYSVEHGYNATRGNEAIASYDKGSQIF